MTDPQCIAFIGGGNMASAIIGGLLRSGQPRNTLLVVEPFEATRARLVSDFGVTVHADAGDFLARAGLVVWAVKPQTFREAALPVASHTASALHLSVAAGITSDSIARWLGNERVIRTMPNTPALIGKGISGVFSRPAVSASDRTWATKVLATMGEVVWLADEAQLDAVTALSGSGPAYVFYFLEAMAEAGEKLGLSTDQAHRLAVATFVGAGMLAHESNDLPAVLRERVTSKGGTTHAAIGVMEACGMKDHFVRAMQAAHTRAGELGREFGLQ